MSPLNGGAERVRTDDLLNANQPLFQLSYGPFILFSAHRGFFPLIASDFFPRMLLKNFASYKIY